MSGAVCRTALSFPGVTLLPLVVLLFIAACSSIAYDKSQFEPVNGQKYASYGTPARITTESAAQLHELGYVEIGKATVRHRKSGSSSVDATHELLALAAQYGGNLVQLNENNVSTELESTHTSCDEWGSRTSSQYYCPNQGGASCYYHDVSTPVCLHYATNENQTPIVRSTGTVWRKQPQLARQAQIVDAASAGNARKLDRLLKQQAHPARTIRGLHLLGYAISNGRVNLIAPLVTNGAVEVDSQDMWVALQRCRACFGILLKHGGSVNAMIGLQTYDVDHRPGDSDMGPGTLLWQAARVECTPCVTVLLEHGADPDKLGHKNQATPLVLAIEKKNLGIIRQLLDHGAAVNYAQAYHSPLWRAVHGGWEVYDSGGFAKAVDLLLRHGANPNDKHDDGWSPLGAAVELDEVRIVKNLLRHGANPNLRFNGDEKSTWQYAVKDNGPHGAEIRALLKRAGAK